MKEKMEEQMVTNLMTRRQEVKCRLMGGLSGLLLVVPNIISDFAFLQAAALLPIFYLATSKKVTMRNMLVAGLYMGLAFTIPQLAVLRLPVWMSAILLVYLIGLLMGLAAGAKWLLGKRTIVSCFAMGCFLAVLDWVNITAVPIWGTAQSFVRSWSTYPFLAGFSSLTGMTGIIFVLGVLQALVAILHEKDVVKVQTEMIDHETMTGKCEVTRTRRDVATAILIVVGMVLIVNIFVFSQKPAGKIKVAAMGWITEQYEDLNSARGYENFFAKMVTEAAKRGARFIVFPEMALYVYNQDEPTLKRMAETAKANNIFIAGGYFSNPQQENKMLFMGSDGRILGEYTKTHLTAFEDFKKGEGELKMIYPDGVRVGGMICQDDNFTDLSREYGRMAAGVVAVPTLDWTTVKIAHFQSSIHRAIESRYGIVRAACNGISAIISPRGEVLAYKDHYKDGAGLIVAEMDVYNGRTFFSIAGNWFVFLSGAFLIVYGVLFPLFTRRKAKRINN